MNHFDVIILGAGGAGLMCAIETGKRGRQVALLDHSPKIGAKILISGGGRCNFTNITVGPENYVSQNPHFCKSALTRYPPQDFIEMVKAHQIPYHEKKLGQLFCDRSAKDIVGMLEEECRKAGVQVLLNQQVASVAKNEKFEVKASQGEYTCDSLVVATGGLSIPKVGATGLGYDLARQFGLKIVLPFPALDGFRFKATDLKRFGDLTGVSTEAIITCAKASFRENILFTHNGLSGPAALQASLYWNKDNTLRINFVPSQTLEKLVKWFLQHKKGGSKVEIKTLLKDWLPKRLADRLCELELPPGAAIHTLTDKKLEDFCKKIQDYTFIPEATIGYSKAEVTRGGVDTDELSSKTMECKKVPGLYFIGEVVDVTGWLGGYNFQWAWSSGWAAGQEV